MKVAWILVLALAGTVLAESQASIASRLNEEGKQLMFASKYDGAAAKFRDAAARDPQAIYFFNLCTADYQVGKFGEALAACKQVAKNHGNEALQAKTDKMIARIRDEAEKQHIKLD